MNMVSPQSTSLSSRVSEVYFAQMYAFWMLILSKQNIFLPRIRKCRCSKVQGCHQWCWWCWCQVVSCDSGMRCFYFLSVLHVSEFPLLELQHSSSIIIISILHNTSHTPLLLLDYQKIRPTIIISWMLKCCKNVAWICVLPGLVQNLMLTHKY